MFSSVCSALVLLILIVMCFQRECGAIWPGTTAGENGRPCGGNFRNETGQLTSPDYPNSYGTSVSCEWYVQSPAADRFIKIDIIFFHTDQKTSKTRGDILRIYDRYVPGEQNIAKWTYSGYVNPLSIIIKTNKLWILFNADEFQASRGRGFKINYSFVRNEYCSRPVPPIHGTVNGNEKHIGAKIEFDCNDGYVLSGHSSSVCDIKSSTGQPSWTGPIPYCITQCSRKLFVVSNNKSIILSQNYPLHYNTNRTCLWEIRLNGTFFRVNLTAEDFALSEGDYLEVFDGISRNKLLGNFSSVHPFDKLISRTNVITIYFRSSVNSSGGIFKLRYSAFSMSLVCRRPHDAHNMMFTNSKKDLFAIGESVKYFCKSGFYLTKINSDNLISVCKGQDVWSVGPSNLPSCISDCKYWNVNNESYENVILMNRTGVILSPAYPSAMFNKLNCSYRIHVSKGQLVEMRFEKLDIDNATIIDIYDANDYILITRVSKSQGFRKIVSTSNDVIISVVKDGIEGGYFFMKYRTLTSGRCSEPTIKHGSTTMTASYGIGSVVRLACDTFFRLLGASEVSCTSDGFVNRWRPPLPKCVGKCGSTSNDNNGLVVSPQYPKKYFGTESCVWTIHLEKGDYSVTLMIHHLQADGSSLTVHSDNYENDITTQCAVGKPCFNITFDINSYFQIKLKPGLNNNGLLFSIAYVVVAKYVPFADQCPVLQGLDENLIMSTSDRILGTIVKFFCRMPYDIIGNNEAECINRKQINFQWSPSNFPVCRILCPSESSGVVRKAGKGAIASVGYPNDLVSGQLYLCVWNMIANDGLRISLQFRYLDIPSFNGESNHIDVFEVFNNKEYLVQRLTSKTTGRQIVIASNKVKIVVNLRVKIRESFRGYFINYSTTAATTTDVTSSSLNTARISSITRTFIDSSTTENPLIGERLQVDDKTVSVALIVGVVCGVPTLLSLVIIGAYLGYRKRHPVRIVIGKKIDKFHNPIYDCQSSSMTIQRLYSNTDFNGPAKDEIDGLDNPAFVEQQGGESNHLGAPYDPVVPVDGMHLISSQNGTKSNFIETENNPQRKLTENDKNYSKDTSKDESDSTVFRQQANIGQHRQNDMTSNENTKYDRLSKNFPKITITLAEEFEAHV